MKISSFAKSNYNYKKCMKVLDCANYIFLDKIGNFEFRYISKYLKSKSLFNKIVYDFNLVNNLIEKEDFFNAASILRNIYENIVYIIVTSFDKEIKVNLDIKPSFLRKKLQDNINVLFIPFFEKDDFDNIYMYLCKLIHPCSMKELFSYLNNGLKYKKYLMNNLKYVMVLIEYMYLNFLYKTNNCLIDFETDFIDCCSYINMLNLSCFLNNMKDGIYIVKRFMIYDTNNNFLEKNKKISEELSCLIKDNGILIEKDIDSLMKKLDDEIKKSKYVNFINDILYS